MLQFDLECRAHFNAQKTKDFPKLLEDIQKAVDNLELTEKVFYASSGRCDEQSGNVFTVTLKIRTTSWFLGGEAGNSLINKILADAQIVQYSAKDSAFERFRKSQNDRFVIPSGHWTRDISKSV